MSKYSHFEMCEKIFGSRYKFDKVKELVPYSRTDMWDKMIELQEKLSLTEKALELACERVKYFEEMQDKEMGFSEFFGYDSDYDLKAIIEQYKEQAKEMMKSE